MFFIIYGHSNILFTGAEPFEQIVNIPSIEGPMWNLVKIGQAVSEKRFEDDMILYLHIYSPGADNLQGAIFWLLPKSFTNLMIHCLITHIEKLIFQHFSYTNAWGRKFWPCRKRSKVILRSSKNLTDRPRVPYAIYQDSAYKLFWLWRRRFLSVFIIYGHGGHLNYHDHLYKFSIPH